MPKGRPPKNPELRAARTALSVVRAETEDKLSQVLRITKETDARTRVLFSKVHNLQAEIAELQTSIKGLGQVLLELCQEPESIHHAEAIVRDWLIKLHKK